MITKQIFIFENMHMIQVSNLCDSAHEEGWVVCRVFKKKNYHKSIESPRRSLSGSMDPRAQLQLLNKDAVLEQLLMYMDNNRSCKQETDNFTTTHDAMQQFANPINGMFMHLPGLDSPMMITSPQVSSATLDQGSSFKTYNSMSDLLTEVEHPRTVDTNIVDDYSCSNWADLDKFVASQLNGQTEDSKDFSSCYGEPNEKLCFTVDQDEQDLSRPNESTYTNDVDIWSLDRSMDPLCHLSV